MANGSSQMSVSESGTSWPKASAYRRLSGIYAGWISRSEQKLLVRKALNRFNKKGPIFPAGKIAPAIRISDRDPQFIFEHSRSPWISVPGEWRQDRVKHKTAASAAFDINP